MSRVLSGLIIGIIVLSTFAAVVGFVSDDSISERTHVSVRGEEVELYGRGIYKYDSVSAVAQGMAQDVITLSLGIPMLLFGMASYHKLKGRLILVGTLGYFLYTYVSYVFYWMLNPMFLAYVAIMSMSFFALIIGLMEIDQKRLLDSIEKGYPKKLIIGFELAIGILVGLMWLGRMQPMLHGKVPLGLEHYNTLVIQALDLGFIVPLAFVGAWLLMKDYGLGYLLSYVIIIKALTLSAAIVAMMVGQALSGIALNPVEIAIFLFLTVFDVVCLVLSLRKVQEEIVKEPVV